ncbi:MAG: ATP-binding protein [Oscillospiraceae bacterium]
MSYPYELKSKAQAIMAERRAKAKEKALYMKSKVYNTIPEINEIDNHLANVGIKVSKAILMSENVDTAIEKLKEENLSLQKRKIELLLNNGFEHDCLKLKYKCDKCGDTGRCDDGICSCMKELLKQLAYEKLSEEVKVEEYSFTNFSLDYYPADSKSEASRTPREVMENIYNRCHNYAANFDLSSQSLLFLGGTGLGKTHLSIAIAGYVIEKGYTIIYSSTQNLLYKLEKERFSKDYNNDNFGDYMKLILECDLLILDDLGAEFATNFTSSTIYNIINSRLLQSKPTIISSNLDSTKKLEERYTERFVSRILGNYSVMKFQGKDIRILKKKNV